MNERLRIWKSLIEFQPSKAKPLKVSESPEKKPRGRPRKYPKVEKETPPKNASGIDFKRLKIF